MRCAAEAADSAPDAATFELGSSFGFDRRLFEDDVTGSLAWAEALGAAGVLSKEDAAAIASGLDAILAEGRRDPAFVSGVGDQLIQPPQTCFFFLCTHDPVA